MKPPLLESIRAIRPKNLLYPGIVIAFATVTLVLFIMATRFLSMAINRAVATPDEQEIQAQLTHLDLASYVLVGKKLNLAIDQDKTSQTPSVGQTSTSTENMPVIPTISAHTTITKQNATIAIFNSTKKGGVAGTLRDDLVKKGFTVKKIGNSFPEETQTVVAIKDRVQGNPELIEEIIAIVGNRFSPADPQLLDDTNPYDIIITIGTR